MAAISHVFTIRRAAQILGRDEDLLWELSDQLEPEDGKLWVYAIDGAETPPSPTMASRRFAKLSRIRSIAPVNLKTSVPRCSAYAYEKSVICNCGALDPACPAWPPRTLGKRARGTERDLQRPWTGCW